MNDFLFKYNPLPPKAQKVVMSLIELLLSKENKQSVQETSEGSEHNELKSALFKMTPWDKTYID